MGRHLEKMAARGWMLEKMTTFGWHYRRMEPKRLRFTVTYHDTFSVFDPEQSEGQQEYQDLCRQSGWEVAAANGPLQAFYTEDEDAPPIETDPRLFLDTVEQLAKKTLFPDILLLVLSVLEACMLTGSLLHSPIRLLSSTASLVTAICWLSILVDTSITLFLYWRWHRKAIIAAAAGKFLPVRPDTGHRGGVLRDHCLPAFWLWGAVPGNSGGDAACLSPSRHGPRNSKTQRRTGRGQ